MPPALRHSLAEIRGWCCLHLTHHAPHKSSHSRSTLKPSYNRSTFKHSRSRSTLKPSHSRGISAMRLSPSRHWRCTHTGRDQRVVADVRQRRHSPFRFYISVPTSTGSSTSSSSHMKSPRGCVDTIVSTFMILTIIRLFG